MTSGPQYRYGDSSDPGTVRPTLASDPRCNGAMQRKVVRREDERREDLQQVEKPDRA